MLMEAFGRSAVPLLGVISGWLVAGSSRIGDWRAHVSRKAHTILLPMVLWNLIALVLVCGAATLFDLRAPQPSSLGWTLNEVLVLVRNPDIEVQMPFLRDLFVCMVAAPLLVRFPVRALLAVAAVAAMGQIVGFGWPLLLRPSILTFFALGIAARRADAAERVAAWPLLPVLVPFALLFAVKVAAEVRMPDLFDGPAGTALDLAERGAAALALWRIAWGVAGRDWRAPLLRVEPLAFLLFCAHLILLWLFGPMIGRLTGPLGAPLYPAYLLLQPLLVLLAVMALAKGLVKLSPAAAKVLSGGRLTPPRSAGDGA